MSTNNRFEQGVLELMEYELFAHDIQGVEDPSDELFSRFDRAEGRIAELEAGVSKVAFDTMRNTARARLGYLAWNNRE